MKRVAIYIRVSTLDKQDTDTQLLPLKGYIKNRGWEIYRIYEDKISGSKESRPELNKLMKDAYKKQFDVIIVFRFDRFSRSTKHLIDSLETFNSLGIDFVSYQEAIDTTTPAGKAMFTMISAFSEFERNIIRERVKAGLEKAKLKGKQLGRPRLDIDIMRLKELRKQGLTIRKMEEITKVPRSTISSYLNRGSTG